MRRLPRYVIITIGQDSDFGRQWVLFKTEDGYTSNALEATRYTEEEARQVATQVDLIVPVDALELSEQELCKGCDHEVWLMGKDYVNEHYGPVFIL